MRFLTSADGGDVTVIRAEGGIGQLIAVDVTPASVFLVTDVFTGVGPFVLTQPVAGPANVNLFVNGVRYVLGQDWTLVGQTATWIGAFALDVNDEEVFTYERT